MRTFGSDAGEEPAGSGDGSDENPNHQLKMKGYEVSGDSVRRGHRPWSCLF